MRTGKQYLESLNDDRCIYMDGQRVIDVANHPAFQGITQTVAGLYDLAMDISQDMQYKTEDGTVANKIYMIPRSREDLRDRRQALEKWAEATCGFVGRSPDHVAAFLAGFASRPDVFARGGDRYSENVTRFYKYARDNDLYVSYVIIPPQNSKASQAHNEEETIALRVIEEKADGIVVRGSQMLGTGAAISDYVFVSCITPLRPGDEDRALSFVVPVKRKGLKLYARPSYAAGKPSVYDYPLSTRFDESDALAVFDDVFIPWEDIFVYKNIDLLRAQFHETPAHVFGNNQAQVRFVTKLKFVIGIARSVAETNGIDKLPPVQEKLGELASIAASIEGMLMASEYACTIDHGVAYPNRRFLYGVVGQQDYIYPRVIHIIRDLVGGGVLQVPSSYHEMVNPETREDMHHYQSSTGSTAEERIKLFKLAWDVIGSEFAGRHQQYEMFYNGAPFVTKGYAFRNYNYEEVVNLVRTFLETYSLPEVGQEQMV